MPLYAIIGFGSLIWDLDDLRPWVTGEWDFYSGPILPLEFSLVSAKRKQALALVIDDIDGQNCPTCVIRSRRDSLALAVSDLATRERAAIDKIGYLDGNSGTQWSRSNTTLDTVERWLQRSSFDGAAWTDGERIFEKATGEPFSVPAAVAHLRDLQGESLSEAHRYIQMAPTRVDTPLRRALAEQSWWSKQFD
ncbi:MAG: hypothetical protein VX249_12050 [Pseudomonadota bacterium]|nr:hypothetical protein [Pseudomonadota bacterium]